MLRKIVVSSILAVTLCLMVSAPVIAATAVTDANNTGSFTLTVGNATVTLKASANVYVSIGLDDATATTSATIAAVNSKGSRMFAMDSDGGPLYYSTVPVGTATVTTIASTTGTDDVAAATGWSAL